ncbi:MAG: hypothetical protein ACTHU0_37805 [Kofleriaceae bacterium]
MVTAAPNHGRQTAAHGHSARHTPGELPDGYTVEVIEYPVTWKDKELTSECQGMARVRIGFDENLLVHYADLAPPGATKLRETMFVDRTEGDKAVVLATGEQVTLAYGDKVQRAACDDSLVVDAQGRLLYGARLSLTAESPDPAYPGWQKMCAEKKPLQSESYIGGRNRDLLVRVTGKIRDLELMKAVEIEAVASVFPCFYDERRSAFPT